jgi:hypothetical protein
LAVATAGTFAKKLDVSRVEDPSAKPAPSTPYISNIPLEKREYYVALAENDVRIYSENLGGDRRRGIQPEAPLRSADILSAPFLTFSFLGTRFM